MRFTCSIGLGLLVGCSSRVETDGGGSSSSSTGDECVVGEVACECTPGGGCDPGLECIVGVCIPLDPETGGEVTGPAPDTSAGELETGVDTGAADSSGSDGSSSGGIPIDCGNGRLDDDEVCDDGNTVSGDGCNADCLPGGQEVWTVVIDGGVQRNDELRRVAIDADDDIYAAGIAFGIIQNDNDGFLVKLDDDGQVQWSDRNDGGLGGSSDGYWGVAVLPDQSVVVTGWHDLETNQREALVRAYSADGEVLWTHFEPDLGDSYGYDVAVDSLGDIVVTGSAHDPMDGAPRTWLAKFAADGEVIWNYRIEVPSGSGTNAMAIDTSDAIVLAAANGYAWVRKLDADAQELWTYSELLSGNVFFGAVATAADDGIFVAGNHPQQIDAYFGHHPADGIDPDWVEAWMGDYGGSAYAQGVAVDSSGRSVWVGAENGGGDYYIFARKLDPDGEAIWTHEVMGLPSGYFDGGFGVAFDSLDQAVAVGTQRTEDEGDTDFWIRKLTQ